MQDRKAFQKAEEAIERNFREINELIDAKEKNPNYKKRILDHVNNIADQIHTFIAHAETREQLDRIFLIMKKIQTRFHIQDLDYSWQIDYLLNSNIRFSKSRTFELKPQWARKRSPVREETKPKRERSRSRSRERREKDKDARSQRVDRYALASREKPAVEVLPAAAAPIKPVYSFSTDAYMQQLRQQWLQDDSEERRVCPLEAAIYGYDPFKPDEEFSPRPNQQVRR